MLQQLYRYMRLLFFPLVAHLLPFAIFGHLLVSLGTGAFVRLEFLGPLSRTQRFSKISELFFFQRKHNDF